MPRRTAFTAQIDFLQILDEDGNFDVASFGNVLTTVNPRIARIGVRWSF